MKKKEKIMIIVLIVIAIVAVVFAVNRNKGSQTNEVATENTNQIVEKYVQVLQDGTKLNTSEKLSKTKTVEGLEFKNIQLTNQGGQTVLLADVTNTNSTATQIMLVDVIILDDAGKEIGKVGGIVAPLSPGRTTQFNASTTMDYANAADFKIVKKSE